MSRLQDRLKAITKWKPYTTSDRYREDIKIRQRIKGAEKYEELFNPDSHTDDELADHAMMEFHDGQEYVAGMRTRMRQLRAEIARLERELREYKR